MANPNVGQRVTANWEAVIGDGPEDNINNDYWLFYQLSKGDGFLGLSGGDYITRPLEYALNSTVQSYSDTDVISTTRVDVFDRTEVQWKEVAGTAILSDLEADRNDGEGKVFGLLPAKLENLKNSMRSAINTMGFGDGSGNGSKDMNGLQSIIPTDPTTSTVVQAINQGTFTFWRSKQTSGVKTTSAGDNRFTSKEEADGGFMNENLKFKGAKLAYDVACLAGSLYFWNPKFLKLVYKKGSWFKMLESVRPANQTLTVYPVRTMANFVTTNRRRLGVVSGIT